MSRNFIGTASCWTTEAIWAPTTGWICSRVNELCWKCPYDEIRTITSCNILYSDAVEKESKRFSRNFVTRL